MTSDVSVSTLTLEVELLEPQDAIRVLLPTMGDLEIYIAVVDKVLVVDTALVSADAVIDAAAFNATVLSSRDLFPLSAIGLDTDADGVGHYVMYGSLHASSALETVLAEIYTLAINVQTAAATFQSFFK
ncbi:hypothetical protein SB14R_03245 [Pseudomonas oryzihabitans]|nr:hypothetical protein NS376_08075 [Pseudomonas psychrotolerans]KTT26500.1 hypothetical protein SB14R_03245 [Pseudomonas psychrotolerans]KTT56696.1 hypothetical protein SB8_14640 [Pseudomonas psychrotolerans]